MADDTSNALIVRSRIDLGHNLGLTMVAEGVETERALTALAGPGCDIAQGYHLSGPLTSDAFDTRPHVTPDPPSAPRHRAKQPAS